MDKYEAEDDRIRAQLDEVEEAAEMEQRKAEVVAELARRGRWPRQSR